MVHLEGAGSNNVHPDEVELNGTMNALTVTGLEKLRHRFEEASRRARCLEPGLKECYSQQKPCFLLA